MNTFIFSKIMICTLSSSTLILFFPWPMLLKTCQIHSLLVKLTSCTWKYHWTYKLNTTEILISEDFIDSYIRPIYQLIISFLLSDLFLVDKARHQYQDTRDSRSFWEIFGENFHEPGSIRVDTRGISGRIWPAWA